MNRYGHFGPAVWPCFVVLACFLLVLGCQDGSGPNLVTSPEGKPDYDAVKPPPPPPPAPADPAIAVWEPGDVRVGNRWRSAHFLKVMNTDGSNLTTIFTDMQHIMLGRPSWSPDGRCIAFYVTSAVNPDRGIWLIDVSVVNGVPTGSNARLFLPEPAWMPAWSPLGDRIAYVTGDNPECGLLCVIPVSGGPAEVLYSSSTCLTDLSWNSDATKIAFEEDGLGARVLDLANMNVTTAVGPEWGGSYPSWARTQDALVFEGVNPASGVTGLYIKQLPSGTPVFVCAGSQPDWSPDDQWLVFHGGDGRGTDPPISKVSVTTGIITELGGGIHSRMPSWRRF